MRAVPRRVLVSGAIALLVLVVIGGLLWIQARKTPGSGQGNCPSGGVNLQFFATPGSGAGHQTIQGVSGPPSPSPTPEPVVSAGHILLTVANNRRTISVPVGTVVDIVLNGASWSLPVSSNPQSLPRSSSASSCDAVRASFRVQGNGWIEAYTNTPKGMGAPDIIFRVTVRVVS
jgi:hypothetical protein